MRSEKMMGGEDGSVTRKGRRCRGAQAAADEEEEWGERREGGRRVEVEGGAEEGAGL